MTTQLFSNLPDKLKRIPRWIVWQYEDIGAKKPTKVPYNPRSGYHADVTNSATWTDFDTAVSYCQPDEHGNLSRYAGIGFVFRKNDIPGQTEYVGIDLDDTSDPQLTKLHIQIFEEFDSYSEVSPSGKGLHIIVEGSIPSGRRRLSVEMYCDVRYFTMTGNTYPFNQPPKPIANRQALLNLLWEQLGGKPKDAGFQGSPNEEHTDEELLKIALNAANGDKFAKLCGPQWIDLYSSQSEADFAFMDIVAFYTDSKNQVTRIFRASHLGQRDKAKRSDYVGGMIARVFDRKLKPVEIEYSANAIETALQRMRDEAKDKEALRLPPPTIEQPAALPAVAEIPTVEFDGSSPYSVPPGLLGQIAQFFYLASPRPVPEIALAASIAFMAALSGRGWNVSNTGLNQYVLLLAPTGTGKEAMASGVSKLTSAAKTQCPSIVQFMGPGEIASGQALLKYLSKTSPCFLSIVGEFGLKMQQLSSQRANPAEMMLKRVLLDLYNKSGAGNILQPSVYSQKENNTDALYAPSVTLLGESTPETFFAAIDETMIADGLLPRFTLVEYRGKRPRYNKHHASVVPPAQLVQDVATLASSALKLAVENTVIHVKATIEADALLDLINEHADAMINGTNSDVTRHLWNRAHIKVMKLAALVAVGVNYSHPVITVENVRWAQAIIEYDIAKLQARFESGEVGRDSEEAKQLSEVKRVMVEYVREDSVRALKYGASVEMHRDKVTPHNYIIQRLISIAAFRHDKASASAAIKRSIQTLIESGIIAEVGRTEMQKKYGTGEKAYAIVDTRIIRSRS
jgi:hypothetical protein